MINLKFDWAHALPFVSEQEVYNYQNKISESFSALQNKTGAGNDYLGWVNLPGDIDTAVIDRIEAVAKKVRSKAKLMVVVGIGGSYLGARAVIEALQHNLAALLSERKDPLVIYAGHQLSEDYMADLLDVLDTTDYAITVISKSGTTTEPAVAFRILKNHLEAKYGLEEARQRIIAITDKEKGALKQLANEEGYETFVVPDDVGGRYSVLTPVGLLPIAVSGFDIRALVNGAKEMQEFCETNDQIQENPVAAYAAVRNTLYKSGKTTEIMVNYLPSLFFFTEWWKQLYGESEGKEGKGIFPAGVSNTTDLHSMGQYIQDGMRNLFETVISVDKPKRNISIPTDAANADNLNYLAGRGFTEVNKMAELGTMLAHIDGGVPNLKISIPELNEKNLGQLIYFFEFACGVSGYILGVNPFDQPGVEDYKRNMFALLGKPGFEEETKKLRTRL